MLLICCAMHELFVAQHFAKTKKKPSTFSSERLPYEVLLLFIVFLFGLTYCKSSEL